MNRPPGAFRVNLCALCAAKLRAILQAKGERAMAEAIGKVLCLECKKGVPGYAPGDRLTSKLKERS